MRSITGFRFGIHNIQIQNYQSQMRSITGFRFGSCCRRHWNMRDSFGISDAGMKRHTKNIERDAEKLRQKFIRTPENTCIR